MYLCKYDFLVTPLQCRGKNEILRKFLLRLEIYESWNEAGPAICDPGCESWIPRLVNFSGLVTLNWVQFLYLFHWVVGRRASVAQHLALGNNSIEARRFRSYSQKHFLLEIPALTAREKGYLFPLFPTAVCFFHCGWIKEKGHGLSCLYYNISTRLSPPLKMATGPHAWAHRRPVRQTDLQRDSGATWLIELKDISVASLPPPHWPIHDPQRIS